MSSTLTDLDESAPPAALWGRRFALGLVLVAVIADLVGVFGVHPGRVSASGDGYALTLRYPKTARAGLDTKYQIRVQHAGGFDKPLTLSITGDYFDIFETQGMYPEPSDETRDGTNLLLTFNPPPGDTFVFDFDAYIQPASQQGRSARVTVLDHGRPAVFVDYTTRLVP